MLILLVHSAKKKQDDCFNIIEHLKYQSERRIKKSNVKYQYHTPIIYYLIKLYK